MLHLQNQKAAATPVLVRPAILCAFLGLYAVAFYHKTMLIIYTNLADAQITECAISHAPLNQSIG